MVLSGKTMAAMVVGVASVFGLYGIVTGVLTAQWTMVHVSVALLLMAWFHYYERKHNFITAKREPIMQVRFLRRLFSGKSRGRSIRRLTAGMAIIGVSLYVIGSILYLLGATTPTILAGLGIGLVVIAIEKHRAPQDRPRKHSRFQ